MFAYPEYRIQISTLLIRKKRKLVSNVSCLIWVNLHLLSGIVGEREREKEKADVVKRRAPTLEWISFNQNILDRSMNE